ncbi:DUF3243 domain-containing protein [Halalkalibacterium ligniniphilum]|uniref:DUF3243 domain-containing protein n=1 Tax=Halalkalibacterium ligniniphilum TaxID=1134413 RepID=UPI000475C7F3|nr:DUF3243 domain-containing protein [Halalkalibacterium ligniniphilum]
MNENSEERVDKTLDSMSEEKKESILADFDHFKGYLQDKMAMGKKMGLQEEQLAQTAEKVGDYLAKHEEPKNREEQLLQELWKVGNQEERHKLAHMLVKLVDSE